MMIGRILYRGVNCLGSILENITHRASSLSLLLEASLTVSPTVKKKKKKRLPGSNPGPKTRVRTALMK